MSSCCVVPLVTIWPTLVEWALVVLGVVGLDPGNRLPFLFPNVVLVSLAVPSCSSTVVLPSALSLLGLVVASCVVLWEFLNSVWAEWVSVTISQ